MRRLVALHRWWGVAFCLLFSAWFASGLVMHFVPFPARNADRGSGAVHSADAARVIAAAFARAHGIDAGAAVVERVARDQWTVGGDYDGDRPLYRVALNDAAGTVLHVSSRTGAVVLVTTFRTRALNYFGAVTHWIYPTVLRQHRAPWRAVVWSLSLVATLGAALGVVVGAVRLIRICRDLAPPHRGLRAWHHYAGLVCAPFILAFAFSGWLSMDDGLLFPPGSTARAELFAALHTLRFGPLASSPGLRTIVIVVLCLGGLAFSLTGVIMAWRHVAGASSRSSSRPE